MLYRKQPSDIMHRRKKRVQHNWPLFTISDSFDIIIINIIHFDMIKLLEEHLDRCINF